MLSTGIKAPDFSLPDQKGVTTSLSDFAGKWLVIYFYPKDDTPGCTKEACAFRDGWNKYQDQQAVVVGISKDSVSSHANFASKYQLPFVLLSDTQGDVVKQYQAFGNKKFMGRSFEGILRVSYLINPQGVIVKAYDKVSPVDHADEILSDIAEFSGKSVES